MGIETLSHDIKLRLPNTNITLQSSGGEISKLIIWEDGVQIKIEVNTVLRGSIFAPEDMEISQKLQKKFEIFVAIKALSMGDLYGGKICAALDRQHPRDLFDVKILLEADGLTDAIKLAFLGYLVSHSRPINEVLNPNRIDIEKVYRIEFEGMTDQEDILDDLIEVQQKLPIIIGEGLTDNDKEFLLSFKKGEPDWNLVEIPHLKDLPAVRWKLLNIQKMDRHKHQEAYNKLERYLQSL